MSIWVKTFEKSRFGSKLSEIVDFGQNLPKCRFWTKLQKMLIIVKFWKNVNLRQYLQICWFWSNFSKNFDFGLYLCKSQSWSKFMKISILVKNVEKFDILTEISILVKIDENLDFSQNCRKILILVSIFEKSRF